jgi:hypothetical protein
VKLSKLKKCCRFDCATSADERSSCWRMKSTAVRAKSRTSSVTAKTALDAGLAGVELGTEGEALEAYCEAGS